MKFSCIDPEYRAKKRREREQFRAISLVTAAMTLSIFVLWYTATK